MHYNSSVLKHLKTGWKFDENIYYTRKSNAHRISKHKDFTLKQWQTNFGLDQNSILVGGDGDKAVAYGFIPLFPLVELNFIRSVEILDDKVKQN